MSIQKIIPNNIGVPAKNWKATSITIDYLNMKAQSTCLGYVNEEAMNDPDSRHIDSNIIDINLYWSEEDKNKTKPKKNEKLKALEEKGERSEEEEKEMQKLLQYHQSLVSDWEKRGNHQVINDELWNAFQVLLKYQYLFHLEDEKLRGGNLISDTNRQ